MGSSMTWNRERERERERESERERERERSKRPPDESEPMPKKQPSLMPLMPNQGSERHTVLIITLMDGFFHIDP